MNTQLNTALNAVPPYVDNRPLLVAGKPTARRWCKELPRSDEANLFGDEVVMNCAP